MKKTVSLTSLLIFLFAGFVFTPAVQAIDMVASIKRVKGYVEVKKSTGKPIAGYKGQVLVDHDVVKTGRNAKATIIFRDGSEIRLFQNTTFVIEKSEEPKDGLRKKFFHNLKLNIGSFWGKFTKGKQRSKIITPTATIGIKGTNVAFSERNDKLSLSLSSGKISVENLDGSMDLQPGKMIKDMTKNGSIKDKVIDLPYVIEIKPDKNSFKIPKPGKEEEIFFTLQLKNINTHSNVNMVGDVYISLDLDKIEFPEDIKLNAGGYQRVRAVVKPFQTADYKTGQVQIFAAMDGEEFLNVGAGQTTLSYKIPKKITKTIRINVNSGEIQK